MSFLNKIVLLPTIGYGVFLEFIGVRTWYTRIDEHCILGAMPMRHNYLKIVEKENVKAILTLNEDHELEYSLTKAEWAELNVDHMQIAVEDYVGVANLEQIKKGIDFIYKHKEMNNTVYVHCKAGRYRSALMVACYLIRAKQMQPQEAIDYLKKVRPIVILDRKRQFNAMNLYYNHLNSNKK
jgi:atypical dual specificity phosphatase